MGNFLRENWIWIVAPIVIVLVLFVVFIAMSGDDANLPFTYTIF
jgi:hypothetical protein